MTGQKLPLKCSVDYISFSAHADYQQTSEFLRTLKPPHVVGLVNQQSIFVWHLKCESIIVMISFGLSSLQANVTTFFDTANTKMLNIKEW